MASDDEELPHVSQRVQFNRQVRVQIIDQDKEYGLDKNSGVWRSECDELIHILREVPDDDDALSQIYDAIQLFKGGHGGLEGVYENYTALLIANVKLRRNPELLPNRDNAIYYVERVKHDCYLLQRKLCSPKLILEYVLDEKEFGNTLWSDHILPVNSRLSQFNYETYGRLVKAMDDLSERRKSESFGRVIILHGPTGSGKTFMKKLLEENETVMYYNVSEVNQALEFIGENKDLDYVVFIDDVDRFEEYGDESTFFYKLRRLMPRLKTTVILTVSAWDKANRLKRVLPAVIVPINCLESKFKDNFQGWCTAMFFDYFKYSSVHQCLLNSYFDYSQFMNQLQYEFCHLPTSVKNEEFAVHNITKLNAEGPRQSGLMEFEDEKPAHLIYSVTELARINSKLGKCGFLKVKKPLGITVRDSYVNYGAEHEDDDEEYKCFVNDFNFAVNEALLDAVKGKKKTKGEDGGRSEVDEGLLDCQNETTVTLSKDDEIPVPPSKPPIIPYNSAPAMLYRLDSEMTSRWTNDPHAYRAYSGIVYDVKPLAIRTAGNYFMKEVEFLDRMSVYSAIDDDFTDYVTKICRRDDYHKKVINPVIIKNRHGLVDLFGDRFNMEQVQLLREMRIKGAQVHQSPVAEPDITTSFRHSYRELIYDEAELQHRMNRKRSVSQFAHDVFEDELEPPLKKVHIVDDIDDLLLARTDYDYNNISVTYGDNNNETVTLYNGDEVTVTLCNGGGLDNMEGEEIVVD
ncbi:unnamed protein product [Bursaphelenchus okinawaensis]|uniref:Uncharacterized protein n=1 Tax=Bursaphelenchus okinawaensis TaxID=465554 RepID=A0A811KT70_9BILA|nr:unnamed protein product [Bursaphelenchus okinawaensis]CAG9112166.1 unnamed protein product [Bursaphelenchus okinawaensis]